jgi:DNA-directed RNA polymerase subunit RPC12/RpoP
MTNKRPVSEIEIPDVKHCPNCGHHILIGDLECPNCGYDVASVEDRLRRIDPIPVAIVLGVFGAVITVSGLTMDEGLEQILVILVGGGLFLSGGGLIVMTYFFNDPMRKRD